MQAKWTKKGVTVDITNTRLGCLEQGGTCGRVEHYSEADVARLGYRRGDDLNAVADGEQATRVEMIRHRLSPRILRGGETIR